MGDTIGLCRRLPRGHPIALLSRPTVEPTRMIRHRTLDLRSAALGDDFMPADKKSLHDAMYYQSLSLENVRAFGSQQSLDISGQGQQDQPMEPDPG